MKNHSLHITAKALLPCIVLLVCLASCAVVGTVVPGAKRITLAPNKLTHGSFKDGALIVDYSYTRSSNEIKVAGVANYTNRMDSLDIRLLALDANGTVVLQSLIFSSGFRQGNERRAEIKFDTTIDVPQEVAGMTFAASGQTRSGRR